MMQRKRPVLSPGDVCRIAKKFQKRFKQNVSIVVLKVTYGDGSDRDSMIRCSVSVPSRFGRDGFKKPYKKTFRREQLWFTGYNIHSGETNKSRVGSSMAMKKIKRGEELCRNDTCGKVKDVGLPCWWCGLL